jgi:hypothetical protein
VRLGEGIPAQTAAESLLEEAIAQVLREKGDSAALLKTAIEQLTQVANQLAITSTRQSAIADQQLAATNHLSSAARSLAQHTILPAPVVNVTVPEAPEQETPVVNVQVQPAEVTVMEPPEVERGTRKRVVRDAQGLITEIIEEPI